MFHDDTGDPQQTLDLYEDGDHLSREGRRRYTEHLLRPPAPAVSVIFHSLDFVVFFLVVVARLLAAAAPRPERAAARRQLLLLRLRPSLVPDPDRHVHGRRLLRRARHGAVAGAQARVPGRQHRLELRDARLLQVLQLLRRQRRRGARRALGLHAQSAGAARDPAGRHLVLHLPGDELHDRRLPRRAARAAQPARRRGVHLVLPAPGRRARSSARRICCRRSKGSGRSRWPRRRAALCSDGAGASSRSW